MDLRQQLLALPEDPPDFKKLPRDIRYLMGCRSPKQFSSTLAALVDPRKHCPFCPGSESFKLPIEACSHWHLRANDFPPDGVERAMLIVPNRHVERVTELDGDDWEQFGHLVRIAVTKHGVDAGGFMGRFGDPLLHSGTIPHFHINLMKPTGNEAVRFTLSKASEDREKNYRRLLLHVKEVLG